MSKRGKIFLLAAAIAGFAMMATGAPVSAREAKTIDRPGWHTLADSSPPAGARADARGVPILIAGGMTEQDIPQTAEPAAETTGSAATANGNSTQDYGSGSSPAAGNSPSEDSGESTDWIRTDQPTQSQQAAPQSVQEGSRQSDESPSNLAVYSVKESSGSAEVPPMPDMSDQAPQLRISNWPLQQEISAAGSEQAALSIRMADQARDDILRGNDDDAIRELAQALAVDATDPFAYFYLGRAWLGKKNYSQALTFFKRAEIGFANNPTWLGETLSFEGAVDEEAGHLAQGAIEYKRALDAAPNNLMARAGYGRLASNLPPIQQTGEVQGNAPDTSAALPAPMVPGIAPPPHSAPPAPPPADAPQDND